MEKLDCHLITHSDIAHLQQLYTGFFLLHKKGLINLRQSVASKKLGQFEESHLRVILNNRRIIYYDMHDCGEILPQYLENVDFYFKRSFSAELISQLPEKDKIFPYGFNYSVSHDRFDRFAMQRSNLYQGKFRLKHFVKNLGLAKIYGSSSSNIEDFEEIPQPDLTPKVIFMARTWNPENLEDAAKKSETIKMNEERAECVKLLCKEFGANFFGGLAIDNYSAKNFKEFLLPEENLSNQKTYLQILKNFPICVATKGLCNSNGWKLAEYIAHSKAIVTEKLHFQPAGDFTKNQNYLEFSTPADCVENVVKLFESKGLRRNLMSANYNYYQNCLRPDQIISNSLRVAQSACER